MTETISKRGLDLDVYYQTHRITGCLGGVLSRVSIWHQGVVRRVAPVLKWSPI